MGDFQLVYEDSGENLLRERSKIYLSRPEIVDVMESVDFNKFITLKSLQYFKNPHSSLFPLDLNRGFESYQFRKEQYYKSHINKIEQYFIRNKISDTVSDGSENNAQICTQRGVLSNLMLSAYSCRFGDWNILATKFEDVIYIIKKPDVKDMHSGSRNDTYHFKFRQYLFSDAPGKDPDTDVPVDENAQAFFIFRSSLKNVDILYSAETNGGIDSKEEIKDLPNLSKLNSCRLVSTKLLWNPKLPWQRHPNIMKWWVQAYLAKVEDIYFGWKTKDGFVHSPVKHELVKNLPKNQQWKPAVFGERLHKFLTIIQERMHNVDCPYTVFEFKFDSTRKCLHNRIHEGKTALSFLSEEFVEHIRKK